MKYIYIYGISFPYFIFDTAGPLRTAVTSPPTKRSAKRKNLQFLQRQIRTREY